MNNYSKKRYLKDAIILLIVAALLPTLVVKSLVSEYLFINPYYIKMFCTLLSIVLLIKSMLNFYKYIKIRNH